MRPYGRYGPSCRSVKDVMILSYRIAVGSTLYGRLVPWCFLTCVRRKPAVTSDCRTRSIGAVWLIPELVSDRGTCAWVDAQRCAVSETPAHDPLITSLTISVADLEGGEPAPPPPLWATDWRRHSRYYWYVTAVLVLWRYRRHLYLFKHVKHGTQNIQNDCHQRLYDSLRAHQIRFRPGLCPGPRWGSLHRSPDPLAGLKGPNSKGEGRGERREKGREGERKGKGKKWRERGPPPSQIPGSASASNHYTGTLKTQECKTRNKNMASVKDWTNGTEKASQPSLLCRSFRDTSGWITVTIES